MKAFPQLKNYFDKVYNHAIQNGYILTDEVSGRRIYISKFESFKTLSKKVNREFWEKYKKVKTQDNEESKEMKRTIRDYFTLKGEIDRMSKNYPIQGTSASITKLACIYLFREILKTNNQFKIYFTNVIHDQILIEVPKKDAQYWSIIVKTCMEAAGDLFCETVRLKAEPEILTKWKK